MGRVVVVGSLSMDLTAKASTLPSPGETVIGESFTMVPGGKANNQAVTCARQGVGTALVGRVGSDPFGVAIRARLGAEGVDISHLESDPNIPTGIAHITVDSTGQNSIIVVPLSNNAVTGEQVLRASKLIEQASVVLVQLEVPLQAVTVVLEVARRAGTLILLNPAPAPFAGGLSDELLSMVDICVPNEFEAAALTQLSVDGPLSALRAAKELLGRGCKAVVVTLGSKGAVYVDRKLAFEIPAFRVPVVDTVAAGDAFCGALAAALAEGADIELGLSRAAAAAGLAVGLAGATSSLPTSQAVDALLGRLGPVQFKPISPLEQT